MSDTVDQSANHRFLLVTLVLVLAAYLAAAAFGLPQRGTGLIVSYTEEHHAAAEADAESAAGRADHATVSSHPPYWTVVPFALLLGAIAVLPLIPATEHWWENNLHRFYVAGGLAALTLAYYLFLHGTPIAAHWPVHHVGFPAEEGANFSLTGKVLANAILSEYVPFIVLLFSLYTISGGIRIEGDLPAHPLTNCAFLGIGALLASFIGTTGAAMLLIRPLLETNRERKHVKHTMVFFIFMVCNCGGLLLPLGDPPLFLGYLLGVPFLWTLALWREWLFVNAALLAIYWVWDTTWHYPKEEPADVRRDETRVHGLRFSGIWPNALLLVGVILSVGLLDPSKSVPGFDWHPWMYMREAAQLALVALSLMIGNQHARRSNRFNFVAITEVAVLFFGIFICMQPALQMLAVKGADLGLTEPWQYFWATGSLSSMLDNAPTYVVFFETAKALTTQQGLTPVVAGVETRLLTAVSLGAVFMGAATYIGNGPNFMVKTIAERAGVPMPSFFGFMLYSVVFLVPILILVTIMF